MYFQWNSVNVLNSLRWEVLRFCSVDHWSLNNITVSCKGKKNSIVKWLSNWTVCGILFYVIQIHSTVITLKCTASSWFKETNKNKKNNVNLCSEMDVTKIFILILILLTIKYSVGDVFYIGKSKMNFYLALTPKEKQN